VRGWPSPTPSARARVEHAERGVLAGEQAQQLVDRFAARAQAALALLDVGLGDDRRDQRVGRDRDGHAEEQLALHLGVGLDARHEIRPQCRQAALVAADHLGERDALGEAQARRFALGLEVFHAGLAAFEQL
jgi:hypothetical protein